MKRSPPAGEKPPGGDEVAPARQGVATGEEGAAGAREAAGAEGAPEARAAGIDETPAGAGTTHDAAPPPLLSDPVLGTPPTVAPVSVPTAEPATPAGLDPAEAAARPPAGRRGKLRRRLRYLRRARELMLRDLGGLVYEVHRTGGGDLQAHAGLVTAKLERLVALEAEARRLEAALSAPREQVILFEPGVGGTCSVCGELFGSDARFCAHCGTPTAGEPDAPPAAEAPAPASERAPTLAEPAAPEVAVAAKLPEPPAEPAAPGAEAKTSVLPPAGGEAQDKDADTDVWRAPRGETEVLAGDTPAEHDRDDADGGSRSSATDPLWTREKRS